MVKRSTLLSVIQQLTKTCLSLISTSSCNATNLELFATIFLTSAFILSCQRSVGLLVPLLPKYRFPVRNEFQILCQILSFSQITIYYDVILLSLVCFVEILVNHRFSLILLNCISDHLHLGLRLSSNEKLLPFF